MCLLPVDIEPFAEPERITPDAERDARRSYGDRAGAELAGGRIAGVLRTSSARGGAVALNSANAASGRYTSPRTSTSAAAPAPRASAAPEASAPIVRRLCVTSPRRRRPPGSRRAPAVHVRTSWTRPSRRSWLDHELHRPIREALLLEHRARPAIPGDQAPQDPGRCPATTWLAVRDLGETARRRGPDPLRRRVRVEQVRMRRLDRLDSCIHWSYCASSTVGWSRT